MRKANKIFSGILVFALIVSGCESLLDADSDHLIFPDENQLNSPNDSIYSMVGIFTQLEKLAERYVLLGELRGDLMDVTAKANSDLREINNHEISPDNRYNKIEDYYSVINHCNYLITHLDTSILQKSEKVMYRNFAAAKAIRAWTYLQLALNYGSVKYYDKPMLTINDTENYVEYTLQELIPILISDLEPWKREQMPGSISLGEDLNSSRRSFFPIPFLLGDLYLWNGDYEKAAIEYNYLMNRNRYIINPNFTSTWDVQNGVFVTKLVEDMNWLEMFMLDSEEIITQIAGSTEYGKGAELDSLSTATNEIIPSVTAMENWNNQIYYHSATIEREGDLRGNLGSYLSPNSISFYEGDDDVKLDFTSSENVISKYTMMSKNKAKAVSVYRIGLLYLRYAEAVNRAGKPNLAFAVLKNGLNSQTLAVDTIVPVKEKYISYTDSSGNFFSYINFENNLIFEYNIGIHSRGCGNVDLSTGYAIPSQNSKEDSIQYVEDKIIEELALETAFEGNRFHDLMRIALRRNEPDYLANKVAEKYSGNKEAIRSKLMDTNNWYIKK